MGTETTNEISRLCESIDALQQMVGELIAINQQLLGELVNVSNDSEPAPNINRHLGMSRRG